MDYQNAFDTVHKLVGKLASYGIRGKVFRWVEAFLNDIQQRVVVISKFKELTGVTSEVSIGGVLGPSTSSTTSTWTLCPIVSHPMV